MQSIASNIQINVLPVFMPEYSKPNEERFLFAYHITISNTSNQNIQLLARHWHIFDSNNEFKEVKGEGVLGKQPLILAGETFNYQSFCELKTDIGMMWGTFLMEDLTSKQKFEVKIPEFKLIQDCRLN
ncbi:MAG: Co2+/Mg2+ efflux protein ApaG [Vicingaceae bacterium]